MIKKTLPHRAPFLFVDRIVKWAVGEKIIAEKDLLPDEWYFTGHFPGKPIMPGVLVSEALAQSCGVLLGLTEEVGDQSKVLERPFFFLASINIKFHAPAKPGETLRMEAGLKKRFGGMFLFDVSAFVGSRRIAAGTLALAKEKPVDL